MFRRTALHFITLLGMLAGGPAGAQSFPSKPIRIVVPFSAGGPTDTLARALAQRLTGQLGQQVLVENKPGANTIIGADYVAKAPADGYMLLLATDATISINPLLYSKLPYNPQADFTPLSVVAHVPEALIVSAALPVRTLSEFIAYAKAHPNKLTYGSVGMGSNAHLSAEAFKSATGITMEHVPYKGMADVMPAIASGQLDATFASPNQALGFMKQGKLRALGMMSARRLASLPDVPTFNESGVPGFDANVWFGLFAPAKTPPPIVKLLADEIAKALTSNDFAGQSLVAFTMEPAPPGPAYFADVLQRDREKYQRFVKAGNVKLD